MDSIQDRSHRTSSHQRTRIFLLGCWNGIQADPCKFLKLPPSERALAARIKIFGSIFRACVGLGDEASINRAFFLMLASISLNPLTRLIVTDLLPSRYIDLTDSRCSASPLHQTCPEIPPSSLSLHQPFRTVPHRYLEYIES